ncbi:ATP-grasp domain-containing protein [Synechococcus sp. AH-224-G16]|nr:ATP-grasp domain-containing protein [Synechococcus sp. AH-224-G16]
MIKVLVTGAGGDTGQGVLKSLLRSNHDIKLFATCISSFSSGLYSSPRIIGFVVPPVSDQSYIPFIKKIIIDHDIDVLIPTVDSETYLMSLHKNNIECETKAIVFVGDPESVAITVDKMSTVSFLKDNGFKYPQSLVTGSQSDFLDFASRFNYQIVVKPRVGNGSKGVVFLSSLDEAKNISIDSSLIAQEKLGSEDVEEITAGCYLGNDNEIKASIVLKRQLKNGSTYIAERLVDPSLCKQASDIAVALGLKYLNIQAMLVDGYLIPFELNGRLSGTTAIISQIFNAPEAFVVENYLNQNILVCQNEERLIALRYHEELYIQPEDLINPMSQIHKLYD